MATYTLYATQVSNAQLEAITGLSDSRVFASQNMDSGLILDCDAMEEGEKVAVLKIVPDLPEAEYYHFYN